MFRQVSLDLMLPCAGLDLLSPLPPGVSFLCLQSPLIPWTSKPLSPAGSLPPPSLHIQLPSGQLCPGGSIQTSHVPVSSSPHPQTASFHSVLWGARLALLVTPHGTQSPSPVPSNFQEVLQPMPSSLLQLPPPWFRPPSSLTWTSRRGPGLAPSLPFTTLL